MQFAPQIIDSKCSFLERQEKQRRRGPAFPLDMPLLSTLERITYSFPDFALTPLRANHSISPESSDGFASVGTILPKEEPPCCRAAFSFIYVNLRQLQRVKFRSVKFCRRFHKTGHTS